MKISRVHPKNGRWYYVRDLEERNAKGRPKQKWEPLTRINEGEAALLAALKKLLEEPAKPAGGNLQTWLAEFLKVYLPTLKNAAVRKDYERMYGVIGEAFADFNVEQVEPGDILDFVSRWDRKPTTRRSYKARLSRFFSYLVLHTGKSGVVANPCREVKVAAPPKRKGKFNPEIYWKIYNALPDVGKCFQNLTFLTRQRPTEIRLLKESQILPTFIRFEPTKTEDSTGEYVDVLRTPEIDAEIERARKLQKIGALRDKDGNLIGNDCFLIQTRDGGGYTRWGIGSMWSRSRDKAGVTGPTTRDVRPYSLASLEEMGVDIREIQKAAAHADFSTTEHYLDQYRSRLVDVQMPLPAKPKKRKT